MQKTQADRLWDKGMEAFHKTAAIDVFPDALDDKLIWADALLRGVAEIVAEATKPKVKSGSPSQRDRLLGMAVYEKLKEQAPKAIAYTPVEQYTFSQLGKKWRMADITERQLAIVASWMTTGGGLAWHEGPVPWGMFVGKCIDWVARAEVWWGKQHGAREENTLDRLREEKGRL